MQLCSNTKFMSRITSIAFIFLSIASNCVDANLTSPCMGDTAFVKALGTLNFASSTAPDGVSACEETPGGSFCTVLCKSGYTNGSASCNAISKKMDFQACIPITKFCSSDNPKTETMVNNHIVSLDHTSAEKVGSTTCDDTAAFSTCHHECDGGYRGGLVKCVPKDTTGHFVFTSCEKIPEEGINWVGVTCACIIFVVGMLVAFISVLNDPLRWLNMQFSSVSLTNEDEEHFNHIISSKESHKNIPSEKKQTREERISNGSGIGGMYGTEGKMKQISRLDSRMCEDFVCDVNTRSGIMELISRIANMKNFPEKYIMKVFEEIDVKPPKTKNVDQLKNVCIQQLLRRRNSFKPEPSSFYVSTSSHSVQRYSSEEDDFQEKEIKVPYTQKKENYLNVKDEYKPRGVAIAMTTIGLCVTILILSSETNKKTLYAGICFLCLPFIVYITWRTTFIFCTAQGSQVKTRTYNWVERKRRRLSSILFAKSIPKVEKDTHGLKDDDNIILYVGPGANDNRSTSKERQKENNQRKVSQVARKISEVAMTKIYTNDVTEDREQQVF